MSREIEIKTVRDALKLLPFEHKPDCCCDLCIKLVAVEGHIWAITERLLADERERVSAEHKACEDAYITELETLRATVQRHSFEQEAERERYLKRLREERGLFALSLQMLGGRDFAAADKLATMRFATWGEVNGEAEKARTLIRQLDTAPSSTEEKEKNDG